jgi:GT2 family glycosyltransferase
MPDRGALVDNDTVMGSSRVAFIVANYDGAELLKTVIPSALAQRFEDFTVTVVDNGSSDGSVDYLRRAWPEVQVVALPRNIGAAAAFNRGIAATDSEFVALLNNDIELETGWLAALTAALEAEPRAASATGKLLQFHRRDRLDAAGDELMWSGGMASRGNGELDRGQYDAPEAVFSASTAAALFRRTAFGVVGPFDEDFFTYVDDVDWGFRAQLVGLECRYVPNAVGYHMRGATTMMRERTRFRTIERRNTISLVVKNYPVAALIRHAPRILLFHLLLIAISARDRELRPHVRGIALGLASLPKMLPRRRRIQRSRRVDRARLDEVIGRDWIVRPPGARTRRNGNRLSRLGRANA